MIRDFLFEEKYMDIISYYDFIEDIVKPNMEKFMLSFRIYLHNLAIYNELR